MLLVKSKLRLHSYGERTRGRQRSLNVRHVLWRDRTPVLEMATCHLLAPGETSLKGDPSTQQQFSVKRAIRLFTSPCPHRGFSGLSTFFQFRGRRIGTCLQKRMNAGKLFLSGSWAVWLGQLFSRYSN